MQVLSLEPCRKVRQGKDARRGKPPLGDGPNGRSHHGMDVFMCVDNDNVDDTSTVKVKEKGAVRGRAQRTVTPRYGVFLVTTTTTKTTTTKDDDDDTSSRVEKEKTSKSVESNKTTTTTTTQHSKYMYKVKRGR